MIVIFLYLFDCSFPLISLIYTNIPHFRVHPCSSVGLIFPLISTDLHWYSAFPCQSVLVRGWYHLPQRDVFPRLYFWPLNFTEPHWTKDVYIVFPCLSVSIRGNINLLEKTQFGCKGTTKNAHLQENRAKVYFQVRFIVIFGYFYTKIHCASLATKIFKNNGSLRTGV